MKIWSDKYGFKCEAKGAHVEPDYDMFVVTSNYSIEEIWGASDADTLEQQKRKQILVQAIKRRFKVIDMYFRTDYLTEIRDRETEYHEAAEQVKQKNKAALSIEEEKK